MFSFRSSLKAVDTNHEKVEELLTRGVEEVFVRDNLKKRLLSGTPLRIKLGFDPTGSKIHIGRAIVLWKLRAFQELGHKVVFLVGDFTAQVGDPSDKLEKRPMLTKKQIAENLENYKQQVGKIVDLRAAEFHYNSTWLSKLGFQEIAELAESFSVQQMSNRRNFKDRFDRGEEVSLREFLYPLMQGYDSVALKADVEIGGFDQLFNLKAGRIIQKHYGLPEQDVLTTKMLPGTDGRKMSTSWGNVINIIDEPADMFGKVMSLRDDLIPEYLFLCTKRTQTEVEEVKKALNAGENPRDHKIKLAKDIVALYHGEAKALEAEKSFTSVFQEGGIPKDVKEVTVSKSSFLADVLVREGIVKSKSEIRRLILEGAVTNAETKQKITDPYYKIEEKFTVRVGPLRFLSLKLE